MYFFISINKTFLQHLPTYNSSLFFLTFGYLCAADLWALMKGDEWLSGVALAISAFPILRHFLNAAPTAP